jgi:transcriptional regulator with XRE-family HTH domain
MSKRITVSVKQKLFDLIDLYCKNEDITVAAFSRKVGKHNRWISEVKRGRNLPSPEEAARMCILLETTPEEILLHEGETDEETAKCLEDIQRVKELVEELRKEEPIHIGASLPITREAWEAEAEKWSDEDLLKAMRKLLAIQEERREKNGD